MERSKNKPKPLLLSCRLRLPVGLVLVSSALGTLGPRLAQQNLHAETILMPSPASTSATSAPSFSRLTLKLGETSTLRPASLGPLQINRRGIVNATFLPPEEWRLTALKPGLVLLKAGQQQWLVSVTPPAKPPRGSSGGGSSSFNASLLPSWLCQLEGLRCKPELSLIQGQAGDYPSYLQAKKWCLSHAPCSFYATLNATARLQWQEQLSLTFGKNYEVQVTPSGYVVISGPCEVGQTEPAKHHVALIDQLSQGLVSAKLAGLVCQQDFLPNAFLVHAKVILLASQEACDLGFDTQGNWLLEAGQSTPHGQLLAKLKSWLEHKNAQIIGEPSLKVRGGVAARAQTGGEFAVLVPNKSTDRLVEKQWKAYGMELKITVQAQKAGLVLTRYHFTLSQPGESRLSTNSLQSDLTMPENQAVLAGVSELQSADSKEQGIELLQKIPLIAPLFRHKAKQQASSKVLLWLYVTSTPESANAWASPWSATALGTP